MGILQILFYLRNFVNFGKLVKLLAKCINDVLMFFSFYVISLAGMSLIFMVVGMEISEDDDDYSGLNIYLKYFIMIFRNSIGDTTAPSYDYWISLKTPGSTAMIYIIWILWVFS
jgi:hypothetical protein